MRQPLPAARSEVDPGKGSVSEERWNLLSAILVVLPISKHSPVQDK